MICPLNQDQKTLMVPHATNKSPDKMTNIYGGGSNNKEINSQNILNKLWSKSSKGSALRDSIFISDRQTNKHTQEIKTSIPLTLVQDCIKKLHI